MARRHTATCTAGSLRGRRHDAGEDYRDDDARREAEEDALGDVEEEDGRLLLITCPKPLHVSVIVAGCTYLSVTRESKCILYILSTFC